MNPVVKTLLIILIVLVAVLALLYVFGKKAQKKQAAQQEKMDAMAQNMDLLIIDKKKMRLKEADLPKVVLDNTPRYLRHSKVPVVKAKAGPRIMNFMCDERIYEILPVKKKVKATISGLYITDARTMKGGALKAPEKMSFKAKLQAKAGKANK